MPRVTFNRLTKKKSHTRKRRSSTLSKAKFKPKTAKANRSLIKSNAYAIRAIKRLMPPVIRCDWQRSGALFADLTDSPAFTTSYDFVPLMNPLSWRACLRQDEQVPDSSTTRVLRMSMNLRYSLQQSDWCQFTMFVVTIRPDSSDRNLAALQIGNDYINSFGQDMNVRLSSDLFKVHYTRNVSLTKNGWLTTPNSIGTNPSVASYDPSTTMARGQVNIKLGLRIRNPNRTAPWKDMEIDQFSPHERYYLLCFFTQRASLLNPPVTPEQGARLDYDALFTTYNSS